MRISHYECGVSLHGKAASFKKVLRRFGAAPAEALCVGDELRDLEAARAARIAFAGVAWGYTRVEALEAHRPTVMVASIDDLLRLFGEDPTGGAV